MFVHEMLLTATGDVGDATRSARRAIGLRAKTPDQHQLQGSAQLEHTDCQGRLLSAVTGSHQCPLCS